jgi:hypothetical protein
MPDAWADYQTGSQLLRVSAPPSTSQSSTRPVPRAFPIICPPSKLGLLQKILLKSGRVASYGTEYAVRVIEA